MAKDLLLEIGTEEIPAKFMPKALEQLKALASAKLEQERMLCGAIRTVGTPRRLVLMVEELAETQSDIIIESKGPSVKIAYDASGVPAKAAIGFARGQGVDVKDLTVKDGYVYAVREEKGRASLEILPEILTDIIQTMNFPKTMRWGSLDFRFVRPIRWLIALYDETIVKLQIAGVVSGNLTRGHRFMGQSEFCVTSLSDYRQKMADNFVVLDPEERRTIIRHQVTDIAQAHGGIAEVDEELLDEVIFLVEYPTALLGSFDKEFLALPKEAIITPMREHQRYFPVVSDKGDLLPAFITVRNGGAEHIDIVCRGNERVLKARLSDAKFFFAEDRKMRLDQRLEKLQTIVFQEGLGTLYDKTKRIQKLAGSIANELKLSEQEIITRAALLSKTDLLTNMVYEFTELQGVMGREYARLDGEPEQVAIAIYEHYLPRYAGDCLPQSAAGQIIGIADKMDNIVATFSRGLIPTGSQDPYALRRQALGIVNIIIEAKYDLSIQSLVDQSLDLLMVDDSRRTKLQQDVKEFFALRIKNVLLDAGIRYDLVDSVMAVGTDSIYDAWSRAQALAEFMQFNDVVQVIQAFSRAGNLVKNSTEVQVDEVLFQEEAERELYQAFQVVSREVDKYRLEKSYGQVLMQLNKLADPINVFFANVMVMAEDQEIRNNRLALLVNLHGLTKVIGDFSKIVS